MNGLQEQLVGNIGWGEKRTELLRYPNGAQRLVTMRAWYWEALPILRTHGFDLYDLLKCADQLSAEYPSGHGYDFDILDNTAYMIRSSYRTLVEDGSISSPKA